MRKVQQIDLLIQVWEHTHAFSSFSTTTNAKHQRRFHAVRWSQRLIPMVAKSPSTYPTMSRSILTVKRIRKRRTGKTVGIAAPKSPKPMSKTNPIRDRWTSRTCMSSFRLAFTPSTEDLNTISSMAVGCSRMRMVKLLRIRVRMRIRIHHPFPFWIVQR